jgi:GNAT superfamily N-acetyltransferase
VPGAARISRGIWSIFADVHGYEPGLVESMYGETLLESREVEAWLALDGTEPVSCAFVTVVGRSLGLFDMMTPARHRRRGAARALLATSLATAADERRGGIDGIVFWASPAGRPLYESLGFNIADLVDAWTLGASAEDLAAVGAG